MHKQLGIILFSWLMGIPHIPQLYSIYCLNLHLCHNFVTPKGAWLLTLKVFFLCCFRPCQCSPEGSDPSNTQCNEKGECSCKRNVIGAKCSQCNTGFYGLESSNPHGCKQCFCYGHTGVCKVANGYTGRNISNQFTSGLEGWMVVNEQGTFCSLFC